MVQALAGLGCVQESPLWRPADDMDEIKLRRTKHKKRIVFLHLSGGSAVISAENQGQKKTDEQENLFSLLLGIDS
jgi:hypothetical protein